LAFVLVGARAGADCVLDVALNSAAPFSTYKTVFPNWQGVPISTFTIQVCDDAVCGCPSGPITGLTILNYGTASGGAAGDIGNLYAEIRCFSKTDNWIGLAYAGVWGGRAAWTWAGSAAWGADPCGDTCACNVSLNLFGDIGACPTDGATIELGPASNYALNPMMPGGLTDACGCSGPWGEFSDPDAKTIRYITKEADKTIVAPGDTISYTIYYGLPGTSPLSSITILDTQPSYTHYVSGSASPLPDGGWDPDPGPPLRLRWTLPGGSTVGGPTGSVTFRLTVDWGGEGCVVPEAGDFAAPEAARLANRAQGFWAGSSCAAGLTKVTGPAQTVVRRYLFWKVADNDILLAPRIGMPDDEITYSIFIRNMSSTRTWYRTRVWDTVPAELDAWGPGFGVEDPCVGWTMSPTGCAAATPGAIVTAAKATILTWTLDMPPGFTIELRWKGRVFPTVPAGSTAINIASIQALGGGGCFLGATGDAQVPRNYTHLAPILLRTTYTTYVGNFANGLNFGKCTDYGFWIAFYPLNRQTDFSLYRREQIADAFAADGGVSLPIDVFTGTCVGGFPGNTGGAGAGCKAERTPAVYKPLFWWGQNCTFPYAQLYKLVANTPLIWEYDMEAGGTNADGETFTGATSLSYSGFMHYTFRRSCCGLDDADGTTGDDSGMGDGLIVFNTGVDAYGGFSSTTPTTVHLFKWDAANLAYGYVRTVELAGESVWMDDRTTFSDRGHWRVMSSDCQIVIHKVFNTTGEMFGSNFSGGRDFGHIAPFRGTGNLVSGLGSGTSYFKWAGPRDNNVEMHIGNVGAAAATYQIWRYSPDNPSMDGTDGVPGPLGGTSGSWMLIRTDTVNSGLAPVAGTSDNSHCYGPAYDAGVNTAQKSGAYKVVLLSGGPIQITVGDNLWSGYSGGSMIHASQPVGQQTGSEFWIHQGSKDMLSECGELYTMVAHCAQAASVVNFRTSEGVSATYTTNAPDETVSFQRMTTLGTGEKRNIRMTLLTAGAVVCQYIMCQHGDAKFFTAPFLRRGTFYSILTPSTVFSGQSFWMTVVVTSDLGGTRVDYCGATSFTGTDPTATIEGTAMESFNFTWSSSFGCSAVPDENGVKLFLNVTFNRLGLQSLVAIDATDGSITGLGIVNVVGADVKLWKEPRLSVAASGDTVRFRICWSNYSSASAFTFVITDAVPVGTAFVPEASSAALDCGNTDGVAVLVSYTTATTPAMPPAGSFLGGNPVAGTRWLRWTVPSAGVQTTGCACFRVAIQ
jgi:uncharacterized repeat protein (TIGR01451 family)